MAAIKPHAVVGRGVLAFPERGSVAAAAEALVRPDVRALLVVNGRDEELRGIVGLLTERDLVRAVGTQGDGVYNCFVRLITEPDYPVIDADAPAEDRLRLLCTRTASHVVLVRADRFAGVLSVWECAELSAARSGSASPAASASPA